MGAVGGCRVVTRAATAETRHQGSTYTLPYNEVSGRMSAEQMQAALTGEAIPADPRDVTPEPTLEEVEAERVADLAQGRDRTADAREGEGGAVRPITGEHQDAATGARGTGADPGAGWAPAPDGQRWDFALVREALAARGLPEGEFGEADGWHVGPDMWNVMITRVQGSDAFRPRGTRARQEWDAALLSYVDAVESAGMEVVRRNAHCVVVRVEVPAELMFTARARRVGALDEFATAVEFEGWPGIGGTVEIHSAGAGAAVFQVRDHTGHAIPDPAQMNRRAATASLARWYGLPNPAQYIEDGQEPPAARAADRGCATR